MRLKVKIKDTDDATMYIHVTQLVIVEVSASMYLLAFKFLEQNLIVHISEKEAKFLLEVEKLTPRPAVISFDREFDEYVHKEETPTEDPKQE